MSARTLAAFSTIRTEGAMLPSDILVRVASGDKSLGGLEESSYHLAGEDWRSDQPRMESLAGGLGRQLSVCPREAGGNRYRNQSHP